MNRLSKIARLGSAAALLVFSSLAVIPSASAQGTSAQSGANNLVSVSIDDEALVLNDEKLRDALAEISFYEPTKVAIYTREGEYSDDINTETLSYAKSAHPEWISADPEDYGDYWADGYFIITLSVEGPGDGQIGTYFGEDRKVGDGQMQSIHEAGYEDFNQAWWTDGVIAVADKGAAVMNRPWYKSPALWITTGVLGGGAGVTAGAVLLVRAHRRQSFAAELSAGSEHLTRVTMDLEVTELSARTLPTGSRHAADLERRFADFTEKYRTSFDEQQDLQAMDKKARSSSAAVQRAKKFRETAEELDATDDAITAAAALYTRSATWEDAWRAQTAPILEDLDELGNLSSEGEEKLQSAFAALQSFGEEARAVVARTGTELKAERIDVDTALDRLRELRERLTARLDEYAKVQIESYAETESEREQMRDKLREARSANNRSRTRGGGSILDVISPADLFWRVQAYNVGYSSGVSAVESSRQSASSSSGGISHGYSGGGSFSGSGGSSRF
ncbi:DUF5129 domain-containing protein [Glutamicibacter endophyticus]|uniref:DUF5129 domain-containing protein n=1 Tax=Glutamicibacter endophyticus TaxID=1522174 RepID=UPI003AF0CB1F